MSSLFSLYREVLPPSVVTHSVSASLIAPNAKNLVVAKSTILEIYNVIESDEDVVVSEPSKPKKAELGAENEEDAMDLEEDDLQTQNGVEVLCHEALQGQITVS